MIIETKFPQLPDDKQSAPWLAKCDHIPKTDEEKWYKPQDNWCDLHQEAVCRECFEAFHKNCVGVSTNKGTKRVNYLRKNKTSEKAIKPERLKKY